MSAATIRVFHKLWHRSIYPKPCSFTLFPPPPTQLRHPLLPLPPPSPRRYHPNARLLCPTHPALLHPLLPPPSKEKRAKNFFKRAFIGYAPMSTQRTRGQFTRLRSSILSPHLVVCLPTKGDEEKMESSRARRVWRRLVLSWLHSRQPLRVFFLHGLLVWMRFPRMGSANDIPSLSPYLFVFPLIPSLRALLCTRASPQE